MQNKTIKFSEQLVPLIVSGQKTCTWRLWDDKNFEVGDVVTFIKRPELKTFAEAEIIYVKDKKFGELNKEDGDFVGHEPYPDLYKAYSEYYGKQVTPDTPIKIIRYKILKLI